MASSSGSISPVAAAAKQQQQQQTAMAASAHARLAAVAAAATNVPAFGKGGKFKSVKDSRAHSAPAVHRKPTMSAEEDETWLYVMPRQRVRPRECDEVPDEFRRAGIGLCFEGKERVQPS